MSRFSLVENIILWVAGEDRGPGCKGKVDGDEAQHIKRYSISTNEIEVMVRIEHEDDGRSPPSRD